MRITNWSAFVKSFKFDRQTAGAKRQLFTAIMQARKNFV